MSDFSLNTNFQVGDEIKIVFDIQNNAPLCSDKTVYIVDLQEMQDIESNPNGELQRSVSYTHLTLPTILLV